MTALVQEKVLTDSEVVENFIGALRNFSLSDDDICACIEANIPSALTVLVKEKVVKMNRELADNVADLFKVFTGNSIKDVITASQIHSTSVSEAAKMMKQRSASFVTSTIILSENQLKKIKCETDWELRIKAGSEFWKVTNINSCLSKALLVKASNDNPHLNLDYKIYENFFTLRWNATPEEDGANLSMMAVMDAADSLTRVCIAH